MKPIVSSATAPSSGGLEDGEHVSPDRAANRETQTSTSEEGGRRGNSVLSSNIVKGHRRQTNEPWLRVAPVRKWPAAENLWGVVMAKAAGSMRLKPEA